MKNKLARQRGRALTLACGLAVAASSQSLAAEPITAVPGSDPFAAFAVVPAQDLATQRGRAGDLTIVSGNQEFKATVIGSTINAGTINSGNATIGENAFTGFSGMAVNVLNTGNGNAINTGVNYIVNLN
ncbi:MAG: hypothetical protein J5I81_05545 [Nitrococcus mobilis]|nr:hypothetical protein [Nitrococcus mobilis]